MLGAVDQLNVNMFEVFGRGVVNFCGRLGNALRAQRENNSGCEGSPKEVHVLILRRQSIGRSKAQAKDMQLIHWLTEIRMRAVPGIGQAMEAQREAGLMAKGAKAVPGTKGFSGGSDLDPPLALATDEPRPITLAEAGIDKHLADKARKFAASASVLMERQNKRKRRGTCLAPLKILRDWLIAPS
jgi:hypothetical protein